MKAIKNEESSQISRLNDEIRALKEKLAQQQIEGNGGNVSASRNSSSVNDEKTSQQIKDLEEAMKSTWEAKSKLSVEYEEERKRLMQEQQHAAQQLQLAKERQWKILEEKSNVEITMAHVKELVKNLPVVSSSAMIAADGDQVIDREGDSRGGAGGDREEEEKERLLERMDEWNQMLSQVISMEKACIDQSTMIQIFQTALLKDSDQLQKV